MNELPAGPDRFVVIRPLVHVSGDSLRKIACHRFR